MTDQLKKYTASADKQVKIITALVIVLFTVVLGKEFFNPHIFKKTLTFPVLIPVILMPSIILVTYIFTPLEYQLTQSELIIKRPLRNIKYKLSDIKSIHVYQGSSFLKGAIRTFGNGGLFGYTGWFSLSGYGDAILYAKRKDQAILLLINKRTIVITPDDLTMADEIRNHIKPNS